MRVLTIWDIENQLFDRRKQLQDCFAKATERQDHQVDFIGYSGLPETNLDSYDLAVLEIHQPAYTDNSGKKQFEGLRRRKPDLPVVVLFHAGLEYFKGYLKEFEEGGARACVKFGWGGNLISEIVEMYAREVQVRSF